MRENPTSTNCSGPTSSRFWEVEGLRAVAAWSIVVFHVWVFTSPAVLGWNLGPLTAFISPLQSGVTLFFVLSGFLLYRPIAAAVLDAKEGPSTLRYLRNRALRILPAYWVILVVTSFVLQSAALGASGHGVTGGTVNPKTFLLDALLLQTYVPQAIWSGIFPAWSLTIEIAFYLLLPILGLAALSIAAGPARGLRRVMAAFGPVLAMVVLGAIGKTLVAVLSGGPQRATSAGWHGVLDRSLLTHADLFGFGMCAAFILLLWERGLGGRLNPLLWRQGGRALAYVGLPLLFLGYYFIPAYAYDSAVACLASVALVRILARRESPHSSSRTFLTHPLTLGAGRRSYSVFLWNYPVLTFLSTQGLLFEGHGAWAFFGNLGVAASTIALLSVLTYRFIEAPALRLKHRRQEGLTALPTTTPA
jgi:peptidoglycan/LPS O-acetylase OafA/YrhL